MASETVDELQLQLQLEHITKNQPISQHKTQMIFYSVGVMAYNEEANIRRTLQAIIEQSSKKTGIAEIIVVTSGCTDNTVAIVQEIMRSDSRIQLIIQERREGKASAINLFLQHAHSPVLVMVGADIIPEKDTLEKLCMHFTDATVGMVGARPVPVNDQNTFVGHAVHLLWRLHDRMARHTPKLGEAVAFRNMVYRIPTDTAVDEISIQAIIARYGLNMTYEPEAVVYNKGPMTVRDFLKQRRRIYAGHLRVRSRERYEAPTMRVAPILKELVASVPYIISSPQQVIWTLGTVAMEAWARLLGHYDVMRNHSHHVWHTVATTKTLEDDKRKLRRICNTQSIIVFHITRAGTDSGASQNEYEDRLTLRLIRKLLPLLRQYVRRDDILSISGSNMLVAVLNADRDGAEMVANRLKHVIAAQRMSLGKHRFTRLLVNCNAVSFAQ